MAVDDGQAWHLPHPVQQRLVGGVVTSGQVQPAFEREKVLVGREGLVRDGRGEEELM